MSFRRELAVITASVCIATSCTAGEDSVSTSPSPKTSATSETFIPTIKSCDEPSAAAMEAADGFIKAQQETPQEPFDSSLKPEQYWEIQNEKRSTIAASLGLHTFSPSWGFYDLYTSPAEKRNSTPFSTYMGNANEFMKNFGVTIETVPEKPQQIYNYGAQTPTPLELETEEAKRTVESIVWYYSKIPAEYVSLAGLKKIYIVANTQNNIKGYASHSYGDSGYFGYYTTDISRMGSGVDGHELYHLIDSAICGEPGARTDLDQAFQEPTNNFPDFYNGNVYSDKYLSYDDLISRADRSKLIHEQSLALATNDEEGYCKAQEEINAINKQVVAVSNYHPNPSEEKAELGNMLTDPQRSDVATSESFPLLRAQARVLIARIYQKAPRIAEYFTKIGHQYYTAKKC